MISCYNIIKVAILNKDVKIDMNVGYIGDNNLFDLKT